MSVEVPLCRHWQEWEDALLFPRFDNDVGIASKDSWDEIAQKLPEDR
jgi:hypothetical protein